MKKSQVKQGVIDAVKQIQTASGRSATGLNGSTKPIGGLEGFDSVNCVEFSCILSNSLGCEITQDVSLFASDRQTYTIDEIVEKVCQIVTTEGD